MRSVITVVEMNAGDAAPAPKTVERAEVEAKQILDAAQARAAGESAQFEVFAGLAAALTVVGPWGE